MIKNRGLAKKWTGMMMTEHVQRLKEWENTIGNQYPKPKADWEWEDLQQTISTAYRLQQHITLKLWRDDKWRYECGIITALKTNQGELLLDTELSIKHIKFSDIDSAQVLDT